jgi:threonine/homoserine/homoserine lactone efflux protein
MVELAAAFGVGVVLGAATGIPLGVLNVALVDAAIRGGARHANGIAIGGAVADAVHALLAFAGLAPLLLAREDLRRGLVIASAAIVLAYAAVVVLRPRVMPPMPSGALPVRPGFGRGIATGLALTLPNPAPLLAWVAVAGAVLPRATLATAIAGALGVLLGSAIWFLGLARIAARGKLEGRAARLAPVVVAVLMVGVVGVALWRVF